MVILPFCFQESKLHFLGFFYVKKRNLWKKCFGNKYINLQHHLVNDAPQSPIQLLFRPYESQEYMSLNKLSLQCSVNKLFTW